MIQGVTGVVHLREQDGSHPSVLLCPLLSEAGVTFSHALADMEARGGWIKPGSMINGRKVCIPHPGAYCAAPCSPKSVSIPPLLPGSNGADSITDSTTHARAPEFGADSTA